MRISALAIYESMPEASSNRTRLHLGKVRALLALNRRRAATSGRPRIGKRHRRFCGKTTKTCFLPLTLDAAMRLKWDCIGVFQQNTVNY